MKHIHLICLLLASTREMLANRDTWTVWIKIHLFKSIQVTKPHTHILIYRDTPYVWKLNTTCHAKFFIIFLVQPSSGTELWSVPQKWVSPFRTVDTILDGHFKLCLSPFFVANLIRFYKIPSCLSCHFKLCLSPFSVLPIWHVFIRYLHAQSVQYN